MRDIDEVLDETVKAEERELLRSIGAEAGQISQVLLAFRGRNGWINGVLMVAQGVAFLAGAWATWKFFLADDTLSALRWGLPAATLLVMSLMMKLAIWPVIQTNRLLLELKRIELQLAHSGERSGG